VTVQAPQQEDSPDRNSPAAPDADAVRSLLRQVIDPEVGIDIVELGLVYRIDLSAERVRVEMTMTSPACPLGETIMDEVYAALTGGLPQTCVPEISLVWQPPWDPSMISPQGRLRLGWSPEQAGA
jgi:metal-sulfur cluster biosynthetic enzyme